MRKKIVLRYALCSIAFFILIGANICPAGEHGMEVIENIDVSLTPRQENYPSVSYNPINEEFMVLWNTSGKRIDHPEDTISYHSVHGQRVSPEGELLSDVFTLSPLEAPSWKTLPKSAHNIFTNEYGVVFSKGPGFWGGSLYKTIIDDLGNIKNPSVDPSPIYPTLYNASHPLIIFNSTDQEYLAVCNDKFVFDPADPNIKNVAYILDRDGMPVKGPIRVDGPDAIGIEFNPQGVYNEEEGNYFLAWEDYRHVQSMWQTTEIYGVLLDREGDLINEVPLIDDFALPNNGRDQRVEFVAYNSDRNEYLVVWAAGYVQGPPSLNGYISGRIFGPDGMPRGPEIIMAQTGNPSTPSVVYVPKVKEYLMVWNDSREDPTPGPGWGKSNDIYARWLKKDGRPKFKEIPICIKEGNQTYPQVAYDSANHRFAIIWADHNAPDDSDVIPGGGPMATEMPGDIRGVIYGEIEPED